MNGNALSVALFERATGSLPTSPHVHRLLDDPALTRCVQVAAHECGYQVVGAAEFEDASPESLLEYAYRTGSRFRGLLCPPVGQHEHATRECIETERAGLVNAESWNGLHHFGPTTKRDIRHEFDSTHVEWPEKKRAVSPERPIFPGVASTGVDPAEVVAAVRRREPLKMSNLRSAIDCLRKHVSDPKGRRHPRVGRELDTDDLDPFVERYGRLVEVSRAGQVVIREPLCAALGRIDRDSRGLPIGLHPRLCVPLSDAHAGGTCSSASCHLIHPVARIGVCHRRPKQTNDALPATCGAPFAAHGPNRSAARLRPDPVPRGSFASGQRSRRPGHRDHARGGRSDGQAVRAVLQRRRDVRRPCRTSAFTKLRRTTGFPDHWGGLRGAKALFKGRGAPGQPREHAARRSTCASCTRDTSTAAYPHMVCMAKRVDAPRNAAFVVYALLRLRLRSGNGTSTGNGSRWTRVPGSFFPRILTSGTPERVW